MSSINTDVVVAHNEADNELKEQEKYLHKLTCCFRGIEKPLEVLPKVDSLEDLIAKLHDAFSTVSVNMYLVNHLMLSYKSKPSEWKKFAKWNRSRYTRNLVDIGNGKFNLLILCWPADHGSAIHDHADSHCFMKLLQGELAEVKFEMPKTQGIEDGSTEATQTENFEEEKLKETATTILKEGDVAYINDNIGLHRVENRNHTDGAVSLHLYCPPFQMCSVFPSGSAKKVKCPVTFYSKYGVRQEQE